MMFGVLFLLHLCLKALCDLHSLQYFLMAFTPKTHYPKFIAAVVMDGQQIQYFDSDITRLITKTKWINVTADYWQNQNDIMQEDQIHLTYNLNAAMSLLNKTTGHHTLQRLYGCDLYNNGTIRGYERYGFDGEDLISLDLKALTWTPDNKPIINELKVEKEHYIKSRKVYLEIYCVEQLKKFANSTVKVSPEVQVFQQQGSSSAELVCHATGFFPRELNLTWQRDGEKMENEVEVRETLPNQDGSFQKRIILRVSPEDQKENNYTCVIQHSSLKEDLKKDLKVKWNKKWTTTIIIVVSVVGVLVLITAVIGGGYCCRKRTCAYRRNPNNDDDPQPLHEYKNQNGDAVRNDDVIELGNQNSRAVKKRQLNQIRVGKWLCCMKQRLCCIRKLKWP